MHRLKFIFEIVAAFVIATIMYVFGYQPLQGVASSNINSYPNGTIETNNAARDYRGSDGSLII